MMIPNIVMNFQNVDIFENFVTFWTCRLLMPVVCSRMSCDSVNRKRSWCHNSLLQGDVMRIIECLKIMKWKDMFVNLKLKEHSYLNKIFLNGGVISLITLFFYLSDIVLKKNFNWINLEQRKWWANDKGRGLNLKWNIAAMNPDRYYDLNIFL